jgi:hypothetical protein
VQAGRLSSGSASGRRLRCVVPARSVKRGKGLLVRCRNLGTLPTVSAEWRRFGKYAGSQGLKLRTRMRVDSSVVPRPGRYVLRVIDTPDVLVKKTITVR